MYLGSDAIALAPFTDRITYLDEGDWAVMHRSGVEIYDRTRPPGRRARKSSRSPAPCSSTRATTAISWRRKSTSSPRSSATRSPTISTWRPARSPFPISASTSPKIPRVTISACGTAYYAGLVAKYWIERYARVPVEIDIASEFRYREAPLVEGGLAVFVSQSGETADTLATLRYCKAGGQRIASIVNVRTSTIARESDAVLPTLAGPEIGVASTKAFTCQLVGARLSRHRARARARRDLRPTRSANSSRR